MHFGCKSVTYCCQDLNNCLQMAEKQNPQLFLLFCMHAVVYSCETRLRDQRGQKIKRMKRTEGNVKLVQKDFHGVSCSPLLHSKVYNLLQSCFKFHRRHQTLPIMSRSIAQENIFSWWGKYFFRINTNYFFRFSCHKTNTRSNKKIFGLGIWISESIFRCNSISCTNPAFLVVKSLST